MIPVLTNIPFITNKTYIRDILPRGFIIADATKPKVPWSRVIFVCVYNTSPLLASIVPILKYYIGNITRRLILSFLPIITSIVYTKKKQAIVFGRYIEDSFYIIEIKPCFFCVSLERKYMFDRRFSKYYSEYYYRQVSYDNLSDK
jgi:hypothetical protein